MPLFEIYNTTTETVVDRNREHTLEEVALLNENLRQERSTLRFILQQDDPAPTCTCGAEYRFECICEQLPDDAPNPHETA